MTLGGLKQPSILNGSANSDHHPGEGHWICQDSLQDGLKLWGVAISTGQHGNISADTNTQAQNSFNITSK